MKLASLLDLVSADQYSDPEWHKDRNKEKIKILMESDKNEHLKLS